MNNLFVSYHLKNPGQNYESVISAMSSSYTAKRGKAHPVLLPGRSV
jgi:hypothetical protein